MSAPKNNSAAADRLPPHSDAAERSVLGCVLVDNQWLAAAEELGIGADWFYDLRHELIFDMMRRLARMGKPVDEVTLVEVLKVSDNLEKAGGMEYVLSLQGAVESAINFPYYAEIVAEKHKRRQLVRVCTEAVRECFESELETDKLLAMVENNVLAVTEPTARKTEQPLSEVLPLVIDEMEEYHKGKLQINGLPTGLAMLDKVIGGIAENYYTVLAGRPGAGKTTLAIDIIKHLAMDYVWWEKTGEQNEDGSDKMRKNTGIPIGVFSLEMTNKSLARRLCFSVAEVSAGKFKQGFMSGADFQSLTGSFPKLRKMNIILDDAGAQTIGQIASKARRWAKQYGIKLFVLDYLQLVLPDKRGGRIDRVQELTDISAEFVKLKKKLNIPWLVLAQMNRNIEQAESKRPPVLSDLKDCGAIEQDADVVGFLYQPEKKFKHKKDEDETQTDEDMLGECYAGKEYSEWPARINAIISKNRDGATGIAQLLFHKNQFRFEDWHAWKVKNGFEDANKGERTPKTGELPSNEEMGL